MIIDCTELVRVIVITKNGQIQISISPCGECTGCQQETRIVRFKYTTKEDFTWASKALDRFQKDLYGAQEGS